MLGWSKLLTIQICKRARLLITARHAFSLKIITVRYSLDILRRKSLGSDRTVVFVRCDWPGRNDLGEIATTVAVQNIVGDGSSLRRANSEEHRRKDIIEKVRWVIHTGLKSFAASHWLYFLCAGKLARTIARFWMSQHCLLNTIAFTFSCIDSEMYACKL